MAFTGDTLLHSPLWARGQRNAGGTGYDFSPMFADIAPVIASVDLAVCHLETPIAPEGEPYSTFPLYGVPAELVGAIAGAGYDRCSTASNHVFDRGTAGIDRTVEVLEAHGVGQTGMARTEDEAQVRLVSVGGISLAHLSYTWSYNGLQLPEDQQWRSALIDPDRIVADATVAKEAGAGLVVVSLHWGAEGAVAVTGYQRRIAQQITEAGVIDLIVGHHAHVVQPIEMVNGVWVAYGTGNILSNLHEAEDLWPAHVQDGVIVLVEATVDAAGARIGRPQARPTWVDINAGWVVRDVLAGLADPATEPTRRGRLEASLRRTARIVGEFLVAA